MLKEVFEDNAELIDKNKKYNLALEERFSPCDTKKEKEIKSLKSKVDELTMREKSLKL